MSWTEHEAGEATARDTEPIIEGYICASRIGAGNHETISIRFRTFLTPATPQAALSARFISAHDRTLPDKVTVPPLASTLMRLGSLYALRRNAFLVFFRAYE